jgi:multiple antibiotic resistance protein
MAITLIVESLRTSSLTFAALFPIINPFGAAPIFLSLTRAYPEPIRRLLARKIALYGFLLMGGSLALGSEILSFFGISLSIIQLAGGFVLANTGWSMLNQKSGEDRNSIPSGSVEDAMQQAFYPLTLPLTVGPGCISVAIALGAHVRQQSTAARIDSLLPFLGALFGMAVVCVLLSQCYQHAGKLEKILGPSGTNIVIRLSAFLLLAMGIQIMWNGLTSALTTLPALTGAH